MNTSTEGIDELLHGLGEIDEILSKIGVFSRTPKLQFEGARESEGFRARQDGLGTSQGVTKLSRNNPSSRVRESTKENRISIKPKHKSYEIEMNTKPRRAQGGLGLLSRSISVQNSTIHAKIPSSREEREGRTHTERERRQRGEMGATCWSWLARGRDERGEGYLRCPRRGPKYPRLKLDTKTPVGAKPEICIRSHPTAEFFFLRLEAFSAMPPCR